MSWTYVLIDDRNVNSLRFIRYEWLHKSTSWRTTYYIGRKFTSFTQRRKKSFSSFLFIALKNCSCRKLSDCKFEGNCTSQPKVC